MRAVWLLQSSLILTVLGGFLSAQSIRLESKLERPYLYIAQRAPEKGGQGVLSVLENSALLSAMGLAPRDTRDVNEVGTGRALLQSVQQLLSRLSVSSEASEIALVGFVPLGNQRRPLVVFHCELRPAGAKEMRTMLASNKLARPSRKVHGRQVFKLLGLGAESASVEVVIVNRDLLVSNDERSMGRLLDPRTTASGGFAREQRYQRLRSKLLVPPGSLLVYADWQALRPRLGGLLGAAPSWLMWYSGIQEPEQLMFVARPAPSKSGQKPGLITSFVLRHSSDSYRAPKSGAKKGSETSAGSSRLSAWRPDGWLDLLRGGKTGQLLAALPKCGLAGVVSRFDYRSLLRSHRGKRMRSLQARIFHQGHHHDIHLRDQILRRLDEVGAVQLMLVGDNQAPLQTRFAFTMHAKTATKARDIWSVIHDAYVATGEATQVSLGAGRKALRFGEARLADGGADALFFAAIDDNLVLAYGAEVIRRVADMTHRQRPSASLRRRNSALASRLQRLGVGRQQSIDGLFALDLRSLADRLLPNDKRKPADRLSGLLGVHAGFFTFEEDLIRLEVFTQL